MTSLNKPWLDVQNFPHPKSTPSNCSGRWLLVPSTHKITSTSSVDVKVKSFIPVRRFMTMSLVLGGPKPKRSNVIMIDQLLFFAHMQCNGYSLENEHSDKMGRASHIYCILYLIFFPTYALCEIHIGGLGRLSMLHIQRQDSSIITGFLFAPVVTFFDCKERLTTWCHLDAPGKFITCRRGYNRQDGDYGGIKAHGTLQSCFH